MTKVLVTTYGNEEVELSFIDHEEANECISRMHLAMNVKNCELLIPEEMFA